MKISVITATFNACESVRKTIESVIAQRHLVHQYIIVDGGSTDGTLQVLREFEKSWSFITVVSEPDDGIYDAFNKGIRRASGDIVAILNAGDWYEDDTLASVVREFLAHDIDLLCGIVCYHSRGSAAGQYWIPVPERLSKEMTLGHPAVFVSGYVYREKVGMFDTSLRIAGDYDFVARAVRAGMTFGVTSKVVVHMVDGGESWRNWKKSFSEAALVRKRHFSASSTYYHFQLWRTRVSRFLTGIGLTPVLQAYRRSLAAIPKSAERPDFPTRVMVGGANGQL